MKKTRAQLKSEWNAGSVVTESMTDDLFDSFWNLMTDGVILNVNDYNSSNNYAVNDLAIYQAALYRCLFATTGTFDPDKWESISKDVREVADIAAQFSFAQWSNATTYADGEFAYLNGIIYESLVNGNTGNQPDTSPVQWIARTFAESNFTNYAVNQFYFSGDFVNNGNTLYVANADIFSTNFATEFAGSQWAVVSSLPNGTTPGQLLTWNGSQWVFSDALFLTTLNRKEVGGVVTELGTSSSNQEEYHYNHLGGIITLEASPTDGRRYLFFSAGNYLGLTDVMGNGNTIDGDDRYVLSGDSRHTVEIMFHSAYGEWKVINRSGINLISIDSGVSPYTVRNCFDAIAAQVASAPVTIVMPAAPIIGQELEIIDVDRNAATNKITINGNGFNVEDLSGTLAATAEINVNGAAIKYRYVADSSLTYYWKIV